MKFRNLKAILLTDSDNFHKELPLSTLMNSLGNRPRLVAWEGNSKSYKCTGGYEFTLTYIYKD
jgi:hypothetical protein